MSPEYVALVEPDTLEPVATLADEALLVLAARVGEVRLIDNAILQPTAAPAPRSTAPRRGDRHMQRVMLKSKIHRATVTDCDLHYVGSITIDPDLLEAADILEHEQVHVVDIDNGARFETYTIAGERGSGDMRVNGAAARLVHRGDTIIVISYGSYDEADLERYEPRVVHVRGEHQPHRHDRRAGGDPALLRERASTGRQRGSQPCPATPPSKPRSTESHRPSACR